MLILQGNWLEGRLHLWGETAPDRKASAAAPQTPRRSAAAERGRVAGKSPPWSPFAVDANLLGRVVGVLAESHAAARAHHVRAAVAWLPTFEGWPVPSFLGLLPPSCPLPAADHPLPLAPWRINLLPLSWMETCALLSLCANGPALGRQLQAGRSLIVWSHLWRLAGALVARQAYLPGILRVDERHYDSRWQPVLDGEDRRRFNRLGDSLPSAAVCVAPDGTEPPDAAAHANDRRVLAQDFLEQAVDRLVRRAVTTPLARAHAQKGRFSGAHAAWLASLRGDGRRIRWEPADDLAQLNEALTAWRRPLILGHAANSRLVFELNEPVNPDASRAVWPLRILVQTVGRPAPYSIWDLERVPAHLRAFGLTSLGQALTLCPRLRRLEPEATPAGLMLDTGAAHGFLSQDTDVLRAAGFEVRTPAWWRAQADGNPLRLRFKIDRQETDPGTDLRLGLDQLAEVSWELVLGDRRIEPEELKALLASDQPLIRWRGQWVAIDRAAATAAIRQLKARQRRPVTLRDLLRLAVGSVTEDGVGIDAGDFGSRGVTGDLMRHLRGEARIDMLPAPENFQGTLRPYQLRGYAWLVWLRQWGLGACLADDMGLGKTIQALALFRHVRNAGALRPILLVCPLSLIANWMHEAARFTPGLTVLAHSGANRAPGRLFVEAAEQHDIVVTSYALLCRDFAALNHIHWSMVVLDEAQTIKNPATLQSRAARALTADFRLALTGTPVENQVGDLWALMDFLNPGLLGTRALFNQRFQRPIRTGTDTGARAMLRQITAPFILRRLKRDPEIVADLPDRIENKEFCSLTPEQAALYAAELRKLDVALDGAEGIARRGLVLATLTRLKQICNHPAHYLRGVAGRAEAAAEDEEAAATGEEASLARRSGKLIRLDALLDEVLGNGECALIFTQYAVMGTLLQDHLGERLGREIPFLHGGVPREARAAMITRFQSEAGPPVLILSLKAGGTGLTLTRANHVFHFDRWWNPAVENQATDRVHRIGQTRNVFVHKFICAGTLEARIDALIESKVSLAEDLVGSGERWLAQLSNERLHEVLALSADAVAADEEEWP